MGWFANIFIVVGLYQVGNKQRSGFVFSFVGEAIWIVHSLLIKQYDLAAVCVLFTLLAALNWCKWGKQ